MDHLYHYVTAIFAYSAVVLGVLAAATLILISLLLVPVVWASIWGDSDRSQRALEVLPHLLAALNTITTRRTR